MGNEWDAYAGDWDKNEDVVLYARNAFNSLCELVALDDLNVLDFGCGTGCLTEKLAQSAKRVVGLDTSSAMLAVLEGKGLPNVVTIGEELSSDLVATHSFFETRFDLIVASSVCGFLPDYQGTLKLLKPLLTSGGVFVQWDWLATDADSDHGLTVDAVYDALYENGFESPSVSVPFSMDSSKGKMNVLMGVGRQSSASK